MLDGVDAGIRRLNRIDAVGGDPHAQAMRLLGDDLHQVEFQKLVELDLIAAQLFLFPHRLACFFRGFDGDIAAAGSAIRGSLGNLAFTADRPAGYENARPAYLAELGAALLRQSPGPVLESVDRKAARNAEMQIKLAVEIFQMAMAVHEAGHHGPARSIDHLGVRRDRHFACVADGLEPVPLR